MRQDKQNTLAQKEVFDKRHKSVIYFQVLVSILLTTCSSTMLYLDYRLYANGGRTDLTYYT